MKLYPTTNTSIGRYSLNILSRPCRHSLPVGAVHFQSPSSFASACCTVRSCPSTQEYSRHFCISRVQTSSQPNQAAEVLPQPPTFAPLGTRTRSNTSKDTTQEDPQDSRLRSETNGFARHKPRKVDDIRSVLKRWADDPANQSTDDPLKDAFKYDSNISRRVPSELMGEQQNDDSTSSELLEEFDRLEALTEEESGDELRPRGSLMHVGGTSRVDDIAVLIGRSGIYDMYYSSTGRLQFSNRMKELHIVRNFATAAEIEPLTSHLPNKLPALSTDSDLQDHEWAIPLDVGAPLIEKMKAFRSEADSEFRKHSFLFQSAHEKVSHPTDLRVMLLEDIAARITDREEKDISEVLLFAVMRFLVSDSGFAAIPVKTASHRAFLVESQETTRTIRQVKSWVRSYLEDVALRAKGGLVPERISKSAAIIKSFASKCRNLVHDSKQFRFYSGLQQALSAKPNLAPEGRNVEDYTTLEAFSSADKEIIRFLSLELTGALAKGNTISAVAPIILKAVNAYDTPLLDSSYLHRLLTDIGVLQPWQNHAHFDRLLLPHNETIPKAVAAIEEQVKQGCSVDEAAGLQDSMLHLRKDWADLPVYCVDPPTAQILDNGISLEPVAGASDQYWIHQHVAHPSAFFSHDHILGQLSYHNMAAHYFGDFQLPMFPQWLWKRFSLSNGKEVLTFSIKLDAKGNILEKDIRPGIIRNVQRWTFDDMDKVLGDGSENQRKSLSRQRKRDWVIRVGSDNLPVSKNEAKYTGHDEDTLQALSDPLNINAAAVEGGATSPISKDKQGGESKTYAAEFAPSEFGPEDVANMKLLGQLVKALSHESRSSQLRERSSKGKEKIRNPYGGIAAASKHVPERAQFATQDPSIRVSFDRTMLQDSEGATTLSRESSFVISDLVSAMRNCTGEWAEERNVPLIYSGISIMMSKLASTRALQPLRESLATLERSGRIGELRRLKRYLLSTIAPSTLSSSPLRDVTRDSTHQASAGSPLRKYLDLINLWQIDARLKEEAKQGNSLMSSRENEFLPMNKTQLDKTIRLARFRLRLINQFHLRQKNHWRILAVARAFYLKETPLPEYLTAVVTPKAGNKGTCTIEELDMTAKYSDDLDADGNDISVDDVWQVQVTDVDVYRQHLWVRMVKRLSSAQ